jgi:hypothetical protein
MRRVPIGYRIAFTLCALLTTAAFATSGEFGFMLVALWAVRCVFVYRWEWPDTAFFAAILIGPVL